MKKLILITIIIVTILSCKQSNNQVDVYFWENSISENMSNELKTLGIHTNIKGFVSDEELYSNVRFMTPGVYDIIMPSYYMVSFMRKKDMLSTIDINRLKNIDNIMKIYMAQPFRTANHYSIPYLAGSVGIVINTKYVDESDFTSWNILWDNKYKGKIIVSDDMRDVFGIALKSLGYSINSMNESEIKASYDKLQLLMPNIYLTKYLEVAEKIANEEYYIGTLYQGDAYLIMRDNPDLKYIIPNEGSMYWIDCLAVPKAGDNIDDVYKLIDYLLLPETASQIAEYTGSIPVMYAGRISQYLSEDIRRQYNEFFNIKNLRNLELQQDVGTFLQVYAKYWNKLVNR